MPAALESYIVTRDSRKATKVVEIVVGQNPAEDGHIEAKIMPIQSRAANFLSLPVFPPISS